MEAIEFNAEVVEVVAVVVTTIVMPYVINLIKSETITGTVAHWLALVLSVLAGVIVGLATGIPQDPAGWVTFLFAVIGGIQVAYTMFKSVGITNAWLEALLGIGSSNEGKTNR